jgi:hypothetical protein
MTTTIILIVAVLAALGLFGFGFTFARLRQRPKVKTDIHSSIQSLRDIGQLSVFKVITKEIVTAEDHSWGSFGKKYLKWLLSTKKMALIFEFDIDFRYDLRGDKFQIEDLADNRYLVRMPPCFYEVRIRDMRIYDETKARFLPILLPDLLNDFLGGTFSEQDKNQLIADAKQHAEQQARLMITNLESEVQSSARATLTSISRAFSAREVVFEFLPARPRDISVQVSDKISLQA